MRACGVTLLLPLVSLFLFFSHRPSNWWEVWRNWFYYPDGYDHVTMSLIRQSDNQQITWRIEQPYVSSPSTDYPEIEFLPGDHVSFEAGGCVQTGGHGKTTKRYVAPEGNDSGKWYSGTVEIPGYKTTLRVAAFINNDFTIPASEDLPPVLGGKTFLRLGYEDETDNNYDAYTDNGYWKLDEGNDDQCKGVGPAWVVVHVVRPLVYIPPKRGYSTFKGPFDLVWTAVDANGLPLNPIWASQIPGVIPGPSWGHCYKYLSWSGSCTSQSPTIDDSHQVLGFAGLCGGGSMNGHANWMAATYVGSLKWTEKSNNVFGDDDYNFELLTQNRGGKTVNNEALGLEFQARETVDRFTSPWWSKFRAMVDASAANRSSDPNKLLNDPERLAVVTGLFGIDGVHNVSESHPVYMMAVRTAVTRNGTNSVEEHWAFFMRNWGNEGMCSHEQHLLKPILRSSYFIQLPWFPDATGFSFKDADIRQTTNTHGNIAFSYAAQRWVFLEETLPDGVQQQSVDGEFTISWTLPSPLSVNAVEDRPESSNHIDQELDVDAQDRHAALNRVSDTSQKTRLTQLFADLRNAALAKTETDASRPTVSSAIAIKADPNTSGMQARSDAVTAVNDPQSEREAQLFEQKAQQVFGYRLQNLRLQSRVHKRGADQ